MPRRKRTGHGNILLCSITGVRERGRGGRGDTFICCIRARPQRTLRPARQAPQSSAQPHPHMNSAGDGHQRCRPSTSDTCASETVARQDSGRPYRPCIVCSLTTGATQSSRRGKHPVLPCMFFGWKLFGRCKKWMARAGLCEVWPIRLRLTFGPVRFKMFLCRF